MRHLEHVSRAAKARAILFVLGRAVLPVDHDINRVVGRLMGAPHQRRRSLTRQWLTERLAADVSAYREAIIYLRHHALHTCIAIGPHCGVCPLRHQCRSVQGGHAPA
jgi:endonuclease III